MAHQRRLLDQKQGRIMLMRPLVRGFTLVELLIGIAVLALLLGLAAPSFMVWMQNTQIRNAADGVLNGLQLARTEAIRRNKTVQFVLGTQTEWTVSVVSPLQQLQYRPMNEGSANAVVQTSPGGSGAVTFDALGGRTTNNDLSSPIDTIDITSSVTPTGVRPLRIVITQSGSARMCDPDVNLKVGDPRRCTQ
jgi:type IV fimbrial biogenesis protein FimT